MHWRPPIDKGPASVQRLRAVQLEMHHLRVNLEAPEDAARNASRLAELAEERDRLRLSLETPILDG